MRMATDADDDDDDDNTVQPLGDISPTSSYKLLH